MAITRSWDEANPAAAQFVSTGPGYFQNHQIDIRERMLHGGVVWNNGTKDFDGLHAVHAGGGATESPDIYKSDFVTAILQWADAQATLLAGYSLVGSKNIPEVTMGDESIGVDAKGAKRALQGLRIAESVPVDGKVNVRAGVYVKSSVTINQVGFPTYYAGGQLTLGVGPLTLPAAGNHAAYVVVLDRTGALTARKGTEVIFVNALVLPNLQNGDNPIGVLDIRTDSINFSLIAASPNAFLVSDLRTDTSHLTPDVGLQTAQNIGTNVEQPNIKLSKVITTNGGVVLVMGGSSFSAFGSAVSVGRAGVPLASSATQVAIGAEAIAAGTYTYQLRSSSVGAIGEWLVVLELPTAVVS